MKKNSGNLCRFEPINMKWAEEFPKVAKLLMDAGWYSFFERVRGYNTEVTMCLAKSYTGSSVNCQNLIFELNEGSIAEATRLPDECER